jgi:hypothetical protein
MIHRYATNIRFAGALPAPVPNPGRPPRMPCLLVFVWFYSETKVSWRNIAITPVDPWSWCSEGVVGVIAC